MASRIPTPQQNALSDQSKSVFPTFSLPSSSWPSASPMQSQPPSGPMDFLHTAPQPSQFGNLFSGSTGAAGGDPSAGGTGGGFVLPLTPQIKRVVTTMASRLGHQAYYEAHGCVDPTKSLRGNQGRLAKMALMSSCSGPQAAQICETTQLSAGGPRAARMRMMMDVILPPEAKAMFEECLSPSTLMKTFMSKMSQPQMGMGGLVPPPGAASKSGSGTGGSVDCSAISHMLMMGSSVSEGLLSPESMENIGRMRNKYLKMKCEENVIMGNLPYRMCCPGKVKPPTMQEAMMMKSVAGNA